MSGTSGQDRTARDAPRKGAPGRLLRVCRDWIGGFIPASRGAVAVQFAIMALPLTVLAFGLFDVNRASDAKLHLQDALDGATLLAARSTATTNTTLQAIGAPALVANLSTMHDGTLTSSSFTITGATINSTATIQVVPTVSNLWLSGNMTVTATSQVIRAMNDVEVAMVLDNTGSMAQTLGSGTKISALKTAASSMVDTLAAAALTSTDPTPVKISVVPYTMTVNVGSAYQNASWISPGLPTAYGSDMFATAGQNRFTLFQQMGVTWAGCVEARPSPYDVTEGPPTTATPATLYVPYFAPDEPGTTSGSTWNNITWYNNYLNDVSTSTTWSVRQGYVAKYNTHSFVNTGTNPIGYQYGPNAGCEIQPLTRLSTNFTAVKAAINAMTVGGDTDIKAGVMWGWHTLSPNAPFADGVPYGTLHHDKIMVLMTDGQNHNVDTANNDDSVYSGTGYIWQNRLGITSGTLAQRTTVQDQKLGLACTNVKTAGIIVYVVVMVDNTVDQSTVKACASSSDKLYLVTDTSQLTGVFSSIASSIGNLRISH